VNKPVNKWAKDFTANALILATVLSLANRGGMLAIARLAGRGAF
jgi:hypothetical protein